MRPKVAIARPYGFIVAPPPCAPRPRNTARGDRKFTGYDTRAVLRATWSLVGAHGGPGRVLAGWTGRPDVRLGQVQVGVGLPTARHLSSSAPDSTLQSRSAVTVRTPRPVTGVRGPRERKLGTHAVSHRAVDSTRTVCVSKLLRTTPRAGCAAEG
jgi:hypothetical protein